MAIEQEAAVESKQRNGTDTEATLSGRLPPSPRALDSCSSRRSHALAADAPPVRSHGHERKGANGTQMVRGIGREPAADGRVHRPVSGRSADQLYTGGDIVTVNDKQPTAGAVAVKGGKILAVGARAEVEKAHKGASTRLVNLADKTLVPGFIDAHWHIACSGSLPRLAWSLAGDPQAVRCGRSNRP
jgi:Imidazolonepropionase-like composite domain, bacteria